MKDYAPKVWILYKKSRRLQLMHNSNVAISLGGVCRKKREGSLMLAPPSIIFQHGSARAWECVHTFNKKCLQLYTKTCTSSLGPRLLSELALGARVRESQNI